MKFVDNRLRHAAAIAPLLASFFLLVSFGDLRAQQWSEILAPSDLTNYAAFFTDSTNGVITNWRFDAGGGSAEIYHTANGGASWNQAYSFGGALFAVAFADRNNGTAVGGDPTCICGGIYRTTDGGSSWAPQDVVSGATPSLYAVFYADANIGYLGGDNGVMMKTTNGGLSWSELSTGTQGTIRNIQFVDPGNGYIVVATQGNSIQGEKVFKTTNGGSSWTQISFSNFVPEAVWFLTPKVGFVAGNGGRPVIMKTTDGGDTWTEKFHDLGSSSFILSMQFVNQYVGYAVGGNPNFGQGGAGVILSTTDGGEHWTAEEGNYPKALHWVHFPTETVGYAVGEGGTILKTHRKVFVPPMPTINVSRDSLNFGSVEVGESRTLTFDISAANAAGLRVDSALLSKPDGFAIATSKPFPAELAQGGKLTVSVTFTPGSAGGTAGDVTIVTNDAKSPTKITLHGTGVAAAQPTAVASIDTLDFGEVKIGQSAQSAVQISAANSAGLVIDSVYITGSAQGLAVTASPTVPASLGHGEAMTITVTYAPQSAEATSAQLAVRSNDASTSTLLIPIVGHGKSVAAVAGEAWRGSFNAWFEPSPANAEALLRLDLPAGGMLRVEIYDNRGALVMAMPERVVANGENAINVRTAGLASGRYMCRIGLEDMWITRRFVVLH